MKDIVIKGEKLKREIYCWLISLFLAEIINAAGIIKYDTSWWELFTQLHLVLALSIIIYIFLLFVRGLRFVAVKLKKAKKD